MPGNSVTEITIVPIGEVDQDLLDYLALAASGCFAASVRAWTNLNPAEAYNAARRQYHSTQLLRKLRDLAIAGSGKILGVTELDLFIPIFTFVFGEAQVGGSAALISAHRLRQEFYGLPAAKDLLLIRAEKEAIHELGHAFGLAHCPDNACVMRFSNSVEEVDIKSSEVCQACSDKLHAPPGSSLAA